MTQPVVFISYSHKDEKEKDKLLAHLGVLQREGLIGLWNDDQIGAGADWEQEISQAMVQARVAILLISANFLTSDFILGKEVPTLLQRRESEGLTVFPVIAKACVWQAVDWLTEMNVRPKNGRPIWGAGSRPVDENLAAIAKEVLAIVKPPRIEPLPRAERLPMAYPALSPTNPKRSWIGVAMLCIGVVGLVVIGLFSLNSGTFLIVSPPPDSVVTGEVSMATADTGLPPIITIESSSTTALTIVPAQPLTLTRASSPAIASTTVPTIEICVEITKANLVENSSSIMNEPSRLGPRVFIYPALINDGERDNIEEPIDTDIGVPACKSVKLPDSNVIKVKIQVFDLNQRPPDNRLAVKGGAEAVNLNITPGTSRDDPCRVGGDVEGKCNSGLPSSGAEAVITFIISIPEHG